MDLVFDWFWWILVVLVVFLLGCWLLWVGVVGFGLYLVLLRVVGTCLLARFAVVGLGSFARLLAGTL